MKTLAVCLIFIVLPALIAPEKPVISRKPKLFFVSSSLTTSCCTTSISVVSTIGQCYLTAAPITDACSKKRRSITIRNDPVDGHDTEIDEIQPYLRSKDSRVVGLQSAKEVAPVQNREGRFFLYYMTTTSTYTVETVSTLTTFTAIEAVTLAGCTPTDYAAKACG